jgi:peptidoglycan hydrolase-like protein with peptidoglycan-binding domain
MEFQQALADKGFYNGPINGAWGGECVEALRKFQESEGLAVDGKLGARSIIALGLGPQRSADAQLLVKPPSESEDEP